jgi:hypothetical protein
MQGESVGKVSLVPCLQILHGWCRYRAIAMTPAEAARIRSGSQGLAPGGPSLKSAGEVVEHLGGVQAQDFLQALWALGSRLPEGTTETQVEEAITRRELVRTWPMRGTLHFVPPADVHWMLELLTPRVIAGTGTRQKQLELDAKVFAKAEKVLLKALSGGGMLSREDMQATLDKAGISTAGQRGYHILWRLSSERLLCVGPRTGKSQTFVLLNEWVTTPRKLDRAASIALLAERYFLSRGPASVGDFASWSGLTMPDARAGLEAVKPKLAKDTLQGSEVWHSPDVCPPAAKKPQVRLVAGFDEMILGYKDRSPSITDPAHAAKIVPGGNGIFNPVMLVDGRVTGIWKRTIKKKSVEVQLQPFSPLSQTQRKAFAKEADRYGAFLGLAASITE